MTNFRVPVVSFADVLRVTGVELEFLNDSSPAGCLGVLLWVCIRSAAVRPMAGSHALQCAMEVLAANGSLAITQT